MNICVFFALGWYVVILKTWEYAPNTAEQLLAPLEQKRVKFLLRVWLPHKMTPCVWATKRIGKQLEGLPPRRGQLAFEIGDTRTPRVLNIYDSNM